MKKIHTLIHRLHNSDMGILFVRLALGIVFIHAGWLKLQDMDQVLAGFASMGMGAGLAYFVAYAEFISGIAIVVGIFVRYFGIILSIIMLVALFKVHLQFGYGLQNNGFEYVLLLLFLALSMVTMGAGKYSLAGCLRKRAAQKEAYSPQA